MRCDVGKLQAYLDDALTSDERLVIEQHVSECVNCSEQLVMLRQRRADVSTCLTTLDPPPHEVSDVDQALARFRTNVESTKPSIWTTLVRRIEMMKQTLVAGRWKPAVIGVMALVLVGILFSFAPVRLAATDFLGVFRIRKFAVIPIDPSQWEQLEGLEDLIEGGMLGEPTIVREPGSPQKVDDAAEASALAGFHVRTPTYLLAETTLRDFSVETGPAMHFEVDRAMMELVLEAVGVEDITLPAVDTLTADVDVPTMVFQEYQVGNNRFSLHQMPSPTATLPQGVEPAVLGEAMLRLLGMPAEDAGRLAQTIDWTSTLVIPLPTDLARFREVEVDGVTGLWVEGKGDSYPPDITILWQRDGIIYMVNGGNIEPSALLRVADSLG